jgi:hypothetical protein
MARVAPSRTSRSTTKMEIENFFETLCLCTKLQSVITQGLTELQHTSSLAESKIRVLRTARDWLILARRLFSISGLLACNQRATGSASVHSGRSVEPITRSYKSSHALSTDNTTVTTRHVHKLSFPLVPQLANLILREATAHM